MATAHLVLAPVCGGKSTYVKNNFDPEKYVLVMPGAFLRASIGIQAMKEDPKPNACECTEVWVRRHVEGAFETARVLNRELAFDGYPRSEGQIEHFLRQLLNSKGPQKIIVHLLVIDRARALRQMEERDRGEIQKQFDLLRLDESIADTEDHVTALQRAVAMVNRARKPELQCTIEVKKVDP